MNPLRTLCTLPTSLMCILVIGVSHFTCAATNAQLIDDFNSGDLSAYTLTRILDDNGGATNTGVAFEVIDGELALTTTGFDGIEQYALIRDGLTLPVGQELQIDISENRNGGSLDIGLYVGGVAPTVTPATPAGTEASTREEYVSVYYRFTSDNILTRGFGATTEFPADGSSAGNQPDANILFIARTAAGQYEAGYISDDDGRVVIQTRDVPGNDASFVGFYGDVRATGTVGFVDNLRIVPIGGTMGDFNESGNVDCDDIDAYLGNIGLDAIGDLAELDLVADGIINSDDVEFLVMNLVETTNDQVGTFLGDLDCNGTVDVLGDAFILVGSLGQPTASYSAGDIDLNGTVDVLGDAFVLVGNLGSTNEE